MKYIVHKRFKQKAICGDINIPALTECDEFKGIILYQNRPICLVSSENAHKYFARNDDGNGIKRGQLTSAIIDTLSKDDSRHQERWDKVWEDEICQKYRRPEHVDHWLWNHAFYNADIETLEYIAALVGARI